MKNSKKQVERELNKIFVNLNSNWVKVPFLLSQLDISTITNKIQQRQSKFSIESLLKFYLWRKIKGLKYYHKALDQITEEDSLNLGFFKEDNKIVLPSKAWYNRFFQNKIDDKLLAQLDSIVEIILRAATQNKIILDIELVKKVIKNNNKNNSSKGKAFKEAIKLVKKLVYPQIKIKIRHNAKFTTKNLLDILVRMAEKRDFCHNMTNTLRIKAEEENVNRGKYPSQEIMLYHFRKFKSVEELRELCDKISEIMFTYAKRNYNILNRRKLDISYDIHKICYYGDKNDEYIDEGKTERGTTHFYQFLTCSIVIKGERFVLDIIPIHKFDCIEELLSISIKKVKSKIRIDKAYFDRGFDKPKIINVIKDNNLKFIMPKIRSETVKAWLRKSHGCEARVIKNFEIGTKDKAIVNLVLVDDEKGVKRAFITNIDIPEQLAHYFYKWYGKRWGIETGYRNLDHDFRPKTTSKNFLLRFFYFIFTVCLFNMWVLVNICVSIALYGRVKEDPIITAKMFTEILKTVKLEYG